ncbi:MAG: DUF2271 domain-containing protein [Actinomycetota bacterium]
MSFPLPRFEAVSRRQFLHGTTAIGALAIASAACSNNDKSVLRAEPITTTSTGTRSSTATTVADGRAPTASTGPTTTVSAADAFPAGAELQVGFTFRAAGGGQVRNPYIAVWVETPAGEMVQTISLWLQVQKARYLDHLSRWYDAETALLDAGGTNNLDALAGATRGGGDYRVVWDGTNVDGSRVAKGAYVLCIEAAREHGPSELMSTRITIGDQPFTVQLADNGELSKGSAKFVV